VAMQTFKTC